MTVSNSPGVRPPVIAAVGATLFAAIAAGSIDLVYAATFAREGVTMTGVMRAIASGVLGAPAFKGGASAALLGALLHFGILWFAGGVFVVTGRFWPIVFQRPLISGTAFGVGVFVVMKIVVKLSRAPFSMSSDIDEIIRNLLVHIFAVGIPMALIIVSGLARPGSAPAGRISG
jgi:hypothetical protein